MEKLRIIITNAKEIADFESRSNAAGFPSVDAFVRNLLFPQHNYAQKWAELKLFISNLESGVEFYIRDALPNTPALLGRWAYEQQDTLGIEIVRKDRTGTNVWRKK